MTRMHSLGLATASAAAARDLLPSQLSSLIHRGRRTRRRLMRWLLELPSTAPARPILLLAQARQLTSRHLVQLEQLVPGADDAAPASHDGAIDAALDRGDRLLRSGYPPLTSLEALRDLAAVFSPACAAAAESALALNRIDLAAVLASWAAAWRGLQEQLDADVLPRPQAAA